MIIKNAEEFGKAVRAYRKKQGLTQIRLSAMSGVGPRFIGELERGKPTIELDKALYVAWMLDMNLSIPDDKEK